MGRSGKKIAYDKLGLSLSVLCGIHCLLMPVALTALPLTASTLFADPLVEWLIIVPGLMLSGWFLFSDYRKHGRVLPLFIFALAASAIIGGHLLVHDAHGHSSSFVTPVAAVALLAAYVINWRVNRHYHTCTN